MVQKLSFFGLGKLGLPLAALFAGSGLRTLAIDIDSDLVDRLKAGKTPYVEPSLTGILEQAAPFITYTTDARAAADTDASIILVATPSDASSPAFSSAQVEKACASLCAALKTRPAWRYHLIVISSTLFPGTASTAIVKTLEEGLGRRAGRDFGVAYVPDFVALGDVLNGYRNPPFLLVGADDEAAGAHAAALYRRIVAPATQLRAMSLRDAELAKVAYNVFCCMKISFGNFLAQLSDRLGGADVDAIAATLALDPKIGSGLLRAGAPFGGACFPRDTGALLHFARLLDLDAPLVRASDEINTAQYDLIQRHVVEGSPRCVAVLGLAFKPGTPVTTGSPGYEFVRRCIGQSIRVVAFDTIAEARADARRTFGSAITCHDTLEDCLRDAETIVVCHADPSFAGLASVVTAGCRIIDPWGCVSGSHPGLVRVGRMPQRDGTTSAALEPVLDIVQ